ncbi:MAG: arginine--tRNA ligase [Thermodesulfobacteriota bacterium]|nr:arginine--tRNA ligase [Thermodesulfobacteriota bacterium]
MNVRSKLKKILEGIAQNIAAEKQTENTENLWFTVEVPRLKQHGDYATNLAMVLAKTAKIKPRDLAQTLCEKIQDEVDYIEKLEIAGPGFINFHFKNDIWYQVLKDVCVQGEFFGNEKDKSRGTINVEFVSANPTGPLHIGHGRIAAVGDAITQILKAYGYNVYSEYYINDVGTQMEILGRSVYLRYVALFDRKVDFPDQYYQGDYITHIAQKIDESHGNKFLDVPESQWLPFFTDFSQEMIMEGIKKDLEDFGVTFDNFFKESSLYDSGQVTKLLDELKKNGYLYKEEGALWFKGTEFIDDKDRVVIKTDGNYTYFASDIAYHKNKLDRGFDTLIDIFGADHHGYVPRMKSVIKALKGDENSISILLVQLVNLLRDGNPVSMSTRAGEFDTLREVMNDVGRDGTRFFYLLRHANSPLDFDLELAKKHSNENPVYYVQYAHARICSIVQNAREKKIEFKHFHEADATLLNENEELDLIKKIAQYLEVVEDAAQSLEPHRIPTYLIELVSMFHSYYNKHRVISDDPKLTHARLLLCHCIKTVVKNGLTLIGVSAPEKM